MVHALIDTLATIHYPHSLILLGLVTCIMAVPFATRKATK